MTRSSRYFTFGIRELRSVLPSVLNRVSQLGHRITIQKHGVPVGVLVPMLDVELLETLLELSGIDPRFPPTERQHWFGVSQSQLPRHLGVYGCADLYTRYAEDVEAGKRMLLQLLREHVLLREIPYGCIGETFWKSAA